MQSDLRTIPEMPEDQSNGEPSFQQSDAKKHKLFSYLVMPKLGMNLESYFVDLFDQHFSDKTIL